MSAHGLTSADLVAIHYGETDISESDLTLGELGIENGAVLMIHIDEDALHRLEVKALCDELGVDDINGCPGKWKVGDRTLHAGRLATVTEIYPYLNLMYEDDGEEKQYVQQEFLDGAPMHPKMTPLTCFAGTGDEGMVYRILSARADINALDQAGSNPLVCAVCHGHAGMVTRLLEESNINVNQAAGKGDGSPLVKERFRRVGLGPNYNGGETPLCSAIRYGHPEVPALCHHCTHHYTHHCALPVPYPDRATLAAA